MRLRALKNTIFAASIYHQSTTSQKTHFAQCLRGCDAFSANMPKCNHIPPKKVTGGMPPNGWRRIARPRASRQHLHALRLLLVVYAWPLVVDAQPQPSASVGPCASLPSPVTRCRPSAPAVASRRRVPSVVAVSRSASRAAAAGAPWARVARMSGGWRPPLARCPCWRASVCPCPASIGPALRLLAVR